MPVCFRDHIKSESNLCHILIKRVGSISKVKAVRIPQFQSFTNVWFYVFLVYVNWVLTTFFMSYLFYAGDLKLHEAVMFYMNQAKQDRYVT